MLRGRCLVGHDGGGKRQRIDRLRLDRRLDTREFLLTESIGVEGLLTHVRLGADMDDGGIEGHRGKDDDGQPGRDHKPAARGGGRFRRGGPGG